MIILLSILIALYSIFSTFFFQIDSEGYLFVRDNFEGLGWYITVYLIGAFIRKYGNKKWDNFRVGLVGTIISAVVICISIYVFNYTMKIDIYIILSLELINLWLLQWQLCYLSYLRT